MLQGKNGSLIKSQQLQPVHLKRETGDNDIEKPVTPYTNTLPDPYYQGIINPLKKRIMKQIVTIDTRFRDYYDTTSATNFHITLPFRLTNVVLMELASFEYTCSFYAISAHLGNNVVTIRKTISGVEESIVIVVPDGNYVTGDLMSYLNNYTATYKNDQGVSNFKDIFFYLDNITTSGSNTGSAKIVITSYPITTTPPFVFPLVPPTSPVPSVFIVDWKTDDKGNHIAEKKMNQTLGWLFGYRNPKGINKKSSSYISEALVDMTGTKYMYLVVNDFNSNTNVNFYGAFRNSIVNVNTFAKLSINTTSFSLDNQNKLQEIYAQPREYFGPVVIQKLQIQLLDEYGRVIDMNRMDYSFSLAM